MMSRFCYISVSHNELNENNDIKICMNNKYKYICNFLLWFIVCQFIQQNNKLFGIICYVRTINKARKIIYVTLNLYQLSANISQ